MMNPFLFLVGLRYFKQRKSRALLHVWGVSLGVAMIVAVAVTNHSIQTAYSTLLSNVAGEANVEITGQGGDPIHDDLFDEVVTVDDVIAAAPVIRGYMDVIHHEERLSMYVLGIDPEIDEEIRTYPMEEGTLPDRQSVTITVELADRLDVEIGDSVEMIGSSGRTEFTVSGIMTNAGIGQTNLGMFGVVHLSAAQELLHLDRQLTAIDVASSLDADAATEHLSEILGDRVQVGQHTDKNKTLDQMMEGLTFLLYFSSVISVLTAIFVIYNNLYAIMNERRYDFAIFRSIGVRRNKIFINLLIEAVGLGVLGSIIGVLFAYGMAYVMATDLVDSVLSAFNISIQYPVIRISDIVLGVAVGVGSTISASLLPASQVLSITPADIFRSAKIQLSRKSKSRHIISLFLIMIGCVGLYLVYVHSWTVFEVDLLLIMMFFVIVLLLGVLRFIPDLIFITKKMLPLSLQKIFGINGRLAGDHLTRNYNRTTVTLAALVTSITFLVSIASYSNSFSQMLTDWVDGTLGWDLRVSTDIDPEARILLPLSLSEDIEEIEGVEYASPQRFTFVEDADAAPIQLSIFEMDRFEEYTHVEIIEGPVDHATLFDLLVEGHHVAITTVTANKFDLKPGDLITLNTPKGLVDFHVVAILGGYSPSTGEIYMDHALYQKFWKDDTVDAFAIRLQSGYSHKEVLEKIQAKFGEERGVVTQSHADFKQSVLDVSSSAFQQINGLLFFAVLVAGLGVFNALLISVRERAKEIGTFRAMGMRKGRVQAIYCIEGFVTGIYGGIIGSIFGSLLYVYIIFWNRKFEGLSLDLISPGQSILSAVVLAALVALVASFWPARKAANTNIVHNLRESSQG